MKKIPILINLFFIITLFACKEKTSETIITEKEKINKTVFKVDERIELLRIAFNLAVQDYIDEKMLPCDTEYSKRVNSHFKEFKNHQLIKYIDDSPNIIIDFPTIGLMFKDFETFEFDNLIRQALTTMDSAYNRKESRGAHAREDFSKRDDKNFMKHTLAWQNDNKVEIKYRDVHSRTLTNDVQYFPPKERVY